MLYNHILNVVMAQRAYNHCHSCSHRAIIHALTLEPALAATHITPCVIIIVTFHLHVLILICECVFTMDAFRETFNILMILGECRGITGRLNLCAMNAIQITHKSSV